jgi:hypothetical protein
MTNNELKPFGEWLAANYDINERTHQPLRVLADAFIKWVDYYHTRPNATQSSEVDADMSKTEEQRVMGLLFDTVRRARMDLNFRTYDDDYCNHAIIEYEKLTPPKAESQKG